MKRIVNSTNAPAPVGPYNHSVLVNGMLFVSGQIAINPKDGVLVLDNITEETHQVLRNVGAILESAGMGYEDVIKCSVFVKDMGQYGAINTVYAEYFAEATAPARELVQVVELPKSVNIEISVIAYKS